MLTVYRVFSYGVCRVDRRERKKKRELHDFFMRGGIVV